MSEYTELVEPGMVRLQRLLPGPIERVWQYLVDSELRSTWFAAGEAEPRVGGKIEHVFHSSSFVPDEPVPDRYRKEEGYRFVGTITRCEPPSALAYTWDGSEVSFELETRGADVLLTLTHRKLRDRKEAVDVSAGWHVHVGLLHDRLRGVTTERFWSEVERYEREYEERVPR